MKNIEEQEVCEKCGQGTLLYTFYITFNKKITLCEFCAQELANEILAEVEEWSDI